MHCNDFNDYLTASRTHYYGILSVTPLLLIYTLIGIWINWGSAFELRNGADVMIRRFFSRFGEWGEVVHILSLDGLILTVVFYYRKLFAHPLNQSVLTGIILEGVCWSFGLYFLMHYTSEYLLSFPVGISIVEQIYLSVGAGVYEEFLFRFLLLSACKLILVKLMGVSKFSANSIALVLSSLAFSGIHYVGELGDPFTYNSFISRACAGAVLGLVFIFRGFGVAAYTHFYYDILVTAL